ncbi:MAG: bifunctional diguanylate cyclase/phosphodiesterase, partial [Fimbriimonadaceae bacterium]|nr:bifunctional diguanylate cyclase/phosphodiesterase [Alphaproteobacteria bacterium]
MWQLPPLKQIGPEQFSDVLKSTPAATFGQIFNVTIVALALHGVTGIYPMTGLWAANMAFCLWTLWRWQKNRDRVVTRISKKAIPRAMISSFLYALPWAILVVLFLGNIPHREEMVMGIAVMGMAAAGCVQLARIYPAALVYLATILTPVLVKSILLGGAQYHFLAALTACYILYLFTIVLNMAIASIERSAAREESEKKVREIDEANAALKIFATTDDLTGLYNRRVFNQLLGDSVSEARRDGTSVSLLFCNLDHFKNINDVAGHDEGDRLLREVADRLRKSTGARDCVARLGSDEFAIIAREPQTPEAMLDLIHLLMDEMSRPVELDGTCVTPQVSIGISVFPHDAESTDAMMKHADMALQRGKSVSRNQYWFFDHQLRSKMTSDAALEADLRIALEEKQFELFYQPKVDIKTGRFHGFESLLRWRRPSGEIVAPGAFFPVAEDRGLMPYISDFVIERFIEDICAWRALGLDSG